VYKFAVRKMLERRPRFWERSGVDGRGAGLLYSSPGQYCELLRPPPTGWDGAGAW